MEFILILLAIVGVVAIGKSIDKSMSEARQKKNKTRSYRRLAVGRIEREQEDEMQELIAKGKTEEEAREESRHHMGLKAGVIAFLGGEGFCRLSKEEVEAMIKGLQEGGFYGSS